MKPTKNHFLISLLATKVTSATEPMAMMSVHEMWFEVSSVARPCAGVADQRHLHPEEDAAEPVEDARKHRSSPAGRAL